MCYVFGSSGEDSTCLPCRFEMAESEKRRRLRIFIVITIWGQGESCHVYKEGLV